LKKQQKSKSLLRSVKRKSLPIHYYGHPILRTHCKPIEEITDEIRELVLDMMYTMDQNNGIGLAAPQIGYPIRLFVLRNYIEKADGHLGVSEPKAYINPKLHSPSQETWQDEERCLSLPGIGGTVERPISIIVEATDLSGTQFIEEVTGLNARVRMHENDHLNGVLLIDRVLPHERKLLDPFLRQIKKKYNK